MAQVDGCADVDLGSSALTNAFPVRRLGLRTGDAADAAAVYVRAPDLVVERLDQRYRRLPDEGHAARYEYEAPRFDFACTIRYDETGLVLDYPGIAVRALNDGGGGSRPWRSWSSSDATVHHAPGKWALPRSGQSPDAARRRISRRVAVAWSRSKSAIDGSCGSVTWWGWLNASPTSTTRASGPVITSPT